MPTTTPTTTTPTTTPTTTTPTTTPTTTTPTTTPTTSTPTTTPTTTTPTTTTPTTTTPTTTTPTTTTPTTTTHTTTTPTTTTPTTTTPTTTTPTTTTPTTTTPTTTTPTTTRPTTTTPTTTTPTTTTPTTTTPTTTTPTTTTTLTITTTEPKKLCPKETQPITGQTAETQACAVAGGIVGIYDTRTRETFCNGVLESPDKLLVPSDCAEYFRAIFDITGLEQVINIGGNKQEIRLTKSNFVSSTRSDGVAVITLPVPAAVSNCPSYACAYEEATMAGQVDFNDCFSAGYGSTEENSNKYSEKLQQMPVKQPDKDGCCDVMLDTLATSDEPTLPGTVASKASPSVCLDSETPATCSADFGSPVYCRTTTAEVVLVGLTTSSPCQPGNPLLSIDFTGGAMGA
ncbi:hypothetical protein RRG08_016140 [Elysia crispata]|uniref:Uncharacterized protein n=1 Tax=Elysia crispata TaxID=231223 RepID=A0AAE0Z2J7_9GAST|nr:hypothetical protein RRG08_016140 [Elysia crispata]